MCVCGVRLCRGMKSLALLCLEGLKCSHSQEGSLKLPHRHQCNTSAGVGRTRPIKQQRSQGDCRWMPALYPCAPLCHPAARGTQPYLCAGTAGYLTDTELLVARRNHKQQNHFKPCHSLEVFITFIYTLPPFSFTRLKK